MTIFSHVKACVISINLSRYIMLTEKRIEQMQLNMTFCIYIEFGWKQT